MLKDAVKIAYNRGRFELAQEILSKVALAQTVDADSLRKMLGRYNPSDVNDSRIDEMFEVPDYVLARAHSASGMYRPGRDEPSKGIPRGHLRSVPDGD